MGGSLTHATRILLPTRLTWGPPPAPGYVAMRLHEQVRGADAPCRHGKHESQYGCCCSCTVHPAPCPSPALRRPAPTCERGVQQIQQQLLGALGSAQLNARQGVQEPAVCRQVHAASLCSNTQQRRQHNGFIGAGMGHQGQWRPMPAQAVATSVPGLPVGTGQGHLVASRHPPGMPGSCPSFSVSSAAGSWSAACWTVASKGEGSQTAAAGVV